MEGREIAPMEEAFDTFDRVRRSVRPLVVVVDVLLASELGSGCITVWAVLGRDVSLPK